MTADKAVTIGEMVAWQQGKVDKNAELYRDYPCNELKDALAIDEALLAFLKAAQGVELPSDPPEYVGFPLMVKKEYWDALRQSAAAQIAALKVELAAAQPKAAALPEGYTSIEDHIAEQEKDPVRKAALDRARERLKRHSMSDAKRRERAKQLLGKIDRFSFTEHVEAALQFADECVKAAMELEREFICKKCGIRQELGVKHDATF